MILKKTIATIIFIIAMLFGITSLSQVVENSCDTVDIKSPAYIVLNDTSIHLLHDSTAIICDRYIVLTKNNGYSIYSKLVGQSKKHVLLDNLFHLLISAGSQDTMLMKKAMMEAEDAYNPYSGKIIRNIKIQVLKPFGATIGDTNIPVVSAWGKTINKSHISTNKHIIKNKLMFNINDTIDPMVLVENSRELSNLPYLQDASIIVVNAQSDSVDILVLAKDKFPWLPDFNYISLKKMSASLKNVNVFGLGQSIKAGLTYDARSAPVFYLSEVEYYIDNLYNQISAAVNFHVSDNNETYQLLLDKEIIPLKSRLGGGFEITDVKENRGIDPTGISESAWFFHYRYFELWSSYLIYNETKHRNRTNKHAYLIPGVTLNNKQYLYRPFVSNDSNSMFNNYTNLLGNIAIVKQRYYRTNYLASFGKAEYLAYGYQISITGGYSWAEFMNKPYIGFGIATTQHSNKLGFIFAKLELGMHFLDNPEQGVTNIRVSYLTNLHKNGRYRFRFLTNIFFTDGINRFTNDLLYLGEEYGFVDMNENAWYGKKRLFVEIHSISYTPWYFLGFRFAIFGFASAGVLSYDKPRIFQNQLLSAIGFGVYVKNDFLAFDSFQVRAAYFPVTPSGISHFGISFSSFSLIEQLNFLDTKPHIVEYR